MTVSRAIAHLFLAALVLLPFTYGSKCSTAGGKCMDVSKCSYTTISKLCPGGASNKCCFEGAGVSCKVAGVGTGKCLVEAFQKCSGKYYSKACGGTKAVRCCVQGTTPAPTVSWEKKVKFPPLNSMKPIMTSLSPSTLKAALGTPCSSPNIDCSNQGMSARMKKLLKTKSSSATYKIIPFSARMLGPAMDALARIFTKVKAEKPDLYALVKTEGTLCCRVMKPTSGKKSTTPSLHSWGVAVDLKIGTKDADPGLDGRTYKGIIALVPYFNAEGFYWGGHFKDAMHFEVSKQLFAKWRKAGLL